MQGGTGGKLHVFLSCLPKVGSKSLTVRDTGSKVSDKEPLKSMTAASVDYRRMAESAAESMVKSLLRPLILGHMQHQPVMKLCLLIRW